MMTLEPQEIVETIGVDEWTAPRTVFTKRGKRVLRKAIPNSEFWALWKGYKEDIKEIGFSVTKNDDGVFEVCWWREVSEENPIPAAPSPKPIKRLNASEPKNTPQPSPSVVTDFNENLAEIELGVTAKKLLKPHQIDPTKTVCAALSKYDFSLDASEMGMGKTFHALAVAEWLGRPLAVVCPASLKTKWEETAKTYFNITPTFVESYDKLRRGTTPWVSREKSQFVSKKTDNLCWQLQEPHLIIFEECHACSNPNTLNSELLRAALMTNHKVLGLSATVANTPLTLKVIGQALELHRGKNWWGWCLENNCSRGRFGGLMFTKNTTERVETLLKIHHHIFPERGTRARRASLKHLLPANMVSTEPVDVRITTGWEGSESFSSWEEKLSAFPKSLQKAFEGLRADCDLDMEKYGSEISPLTKNLRARQAQELLKVPYLIEEIKEALAEGFSVPVFVLFNRTVSVLQEELKDLSPRILTGDVPSQEREKTLRAFQSNTLKLLILNLAAGAEGIDLHDTHGDSPRLSIICPTYSARLLLQALGRIDRVGKKSVSTQRLIFASHGVERKIMQAVHEKLGNLALVNDGDLSENVLLKETKK
jgi:superfamily II DNA or RNA helicase